MWVVNFVDASVFSFSKKITFSELIFFENVNSLGGVPHVTWKFIMKIKPTWNQMIPQLSFRNYYKVAYVGIITQAYPEKSFYWKNMLILFSFIHQTKSCEACLKYIYGEVTRNNSRKSKLFWAIGVEWNLLLLATSIYSQMIM